MLEQGETAVSQASAKLRAMGIEILQVRFPWGMDANEYAVKKGGEFIAKAVQDALWLGGGVPEPEEPATEPALIERGEYFTITLSDIEYRIGGLTKNNSLEVMKITLRVSYDGLMHVDTLDLYRDVDRRKFIERANEETLLDRTLLKKNLGTILLSLEQKQEKRILGVTEEPEKRSQMTERDREEAFRFLKNGDLLEKVVNLYDFIGLVGEKTNKIAAFLSCVSRKLRKPLAIVIQSTSAAGKSTLMDSVLSFMPPEEQMRYSSMTQQSLYYMSNLKHKILAIAEEEGASKTSYSLKLLQSEGELTIASTQKDSSTGKMVSKDYHVEGPVSLIFTTTSIDIDEELMNRCLVLTVDESAAQTKRIHDLQRHARTLEGVLAREERTDTQKLMQNVQRLLEPVLVVNPFAPQLSFQHGRTRTRRDHEKYLSLIESIALLHQFQRKRHTLTKKNGESLEYIEVTQSDIDQADELAFELFNRSLDELPPQTRRLLDAIEKLMDCKTKKLPAREHYFTRRELRSQIGWTEYQVRTHLQRLESMEYVQRRKGKQGSLYEYELVNNDTTAELRGKTLVS